MSHSDRAEQRIVGERTVRGHAVGGHTVGIVLAAGAGTRMGRPKALMCTPDGSPWLELAERTLRAGGCTEVILVLGASLDPAETPKQHPSDPDIDAFLESRRIVVARDWATGVSASLRAGLRAAGETTADTALITLVDLPYLEAETVARVLAHATGPDALARGVDGGRPAHPVLIGRNHWEPLMDALAGDHGAREYLRANGATPVDVTGLGGADDVDHAPDR